MLILLLKKINNMRNRKTKKKIGLALGGGGWRGLAHIGILKVLEENNIPIDLIAGTSAGGLIGGLYDYFGNAKDLESFISNFGYRDLFGVISDPKLKGGLIRGFKFTKYIDNLTNNINIEDLKIPFSAVSTDLLTGESIYIKSGNMAAAIKASISIPLLFQPSFLKDKFLVDGGVTENIPVKCVKEMGADVIIAVNLNSSIFPVRSNDISSSSKIAIVTSRITLDHLAKYLVKDADVLIEPKIPKQSIRLSLNYFLRFIKEKEIIKIGEEEAKKHINEIRRLVS